MHTRWHWFKNPITGNINRIDTKIGQHVNYHVVFKPAKFHDYISNRIWIRVKIVKLAPNLSALPSWIFQRHFLFLDLSAHQLQGLDGGPGSDRSDGAVRVPRQSMDVIRWRQHHPPQVGIGPHYGHWRCYDLGSRSGRLPQYVRMRTSSVTPHHQPSVARLSHPRSRLFFER